MGCFDSKTESKSTLPKFLKEPTKAVAGQTQDLLNKPFVAYDKPLTTGMTGTQTTAMDRLKAMLEGGEFTVPRLIDDIGQGGSIEAYMDPYIANVINPAIRKLQESYSGANQDFNRMATMAGAFGTDDAFFQGKQRLAGEEARDIAETTGSMMSGAYNNAQGLRQFDINQLVAGRDAELKVANDLFGMGTQEQRTDQAALTASYEQFLREQGWDFEKAKTVATILGSLNSQSQTTQQPSDAASILSAASSISSILFGG